MFYKFSFRKRGKICRRVAQTQRSRQADPPLHGSQVAARRYQLLASFDVPNPRTVPRCHRHRINLALLSFQLSFPLFFPFFHNAISSSAYPHLRHRAIKEESLP